MSYSDDDFSDSGDDDTFNEDMEALRRACLLTGAEPAGGATATSSPEESADDSADDDIEFARNLQKRFSDYADFSASMSLTPLWSVPFRDDDDDDVEDDFEALKAIQRRFSAYDHGGVKENTEDCNDMIEQVGVTNKIALEKGGSNNLFVKTNINAEEGFPNCVDTDNIATQNLGACSDHVTSELGVACSDRVTSQLVEECQNSGARNVPTLPLKTTGLPKSALAFVDAIKKNRACQKVIRSKLMQVQARIEENKKLKDRVKILKDFQTGCKKRTGRALAQKKDNRVQLISAAKPRSSSKSNDKKTPAMCYGPPENPHFAIYKEVLTKFPSTVSRDKWSKKEIDNLKKGVKQQFQEKLLQQSVDILQDTEEWSKEGSNLDMIVASVRDYDITPQNMRSFLPKINWEQLASMYVPSRSGVECQSRWLNCEDPLINWSPWTNVEDKNLLHIVQQKGPSNWIDISVSLGTNRTPFQCLARYQRSLNASIIRREWTKEEDMKIHDAVEEYGENNWQVVASVMEGRTGTQCSNRWMKSLHPARKRVGKWTPEEDKRLKVAVMIIGPKNWSKIAEFVPGRMQAQCRERWANCLDPSLNFGSWTSEEDLSLEEAIKKHGYCWSKVASCVPHRTDNQCMRRWTMLFPEQVPMFRAAKKTKRDGMICNFVDRESERPAIGPNDFFQLPAIEPLPRLKKTSRRRRVRHSRKVNSSDDDSSEEVLRLTCGSEGEDGQEVVTSVTQVRRSSRQKKRKVITDYDSMVTQDSVGRNKKQKLMSENDRNLTMSNCENPDNVESLDHFIAEPPKRCKFRRSKLKDEACSPDNDETEDEDDMTLDSFLLRSRGATKLSHLAEPAKTVSASAGEECTSQEDENASDGGVSGPKRQKRLSIGEETSSDQRQVEECGDDLPLSRFCKKLKDKQAIAQSVTASAVVDHTAQMDDNASVAGVSGSKRRKRLSSVEETPSDQMQVEESGDDLPLSRFCNKLKDKRAIAQSVTASAVVDHTAQIYDNASVAGVSGSKRRKRLSSVEETPSDQMQVEESGDDLPLSRFCNKLKDKLAIAQSGTASAVVDHTAQMDDNASVAGVSGSKRRKKVHRRKPLVIKCR